VVTWRTSKTLKKERKIAAFQVELRELEAENSTIQASAAGHGLTSSASVIDAMVS
jgi:hypothetical protein